jgi:hypothetical protein
MDMKKFSCLKWDDVIVDGKPFFDSSEQEIEGLTGFIQFFNQ